VTIIAWDGKTVAADTALTCGVLVAQTTKIFTFDNKRGKGILAVCGDAAPGSGVKSWFVENKPDFPKLKDEEDVQMIVFYASGEIELYANSEHPIEMNVDQFAWGSGAEMAMGAMKSGASAVEACFTVCESEVYCSPPIMECCPVKRKIFTHHLRPSLARLVSVS